LGRNGLQCLPTLARRYAGAMACEAGLVKTRSMNAFKLTAFAILSTFAGAMVFAGTSFGVRRKRMQCSINFQTIDKFLAKSRNYLGL
jgi:hypothetical protein